VLGRRVVAVETAEENLGRRAAHRGRILGEDRHGGFEQVGKLDVVEADERVRVLEPQVAERVECADRHEVLRGEESGRWVRSSKELVRCECRGIDASKARADDRRLLADPEGRKAAVVTTKAICRRLDLQRIAQEPNSSMPEGSEVGDGPLGPADVVRRDGVGIDEARRAVDEHEWRACALFREEVAMVRARGHDDDAVDPAPAKRPDQLSLTVGIFVAAPGEEQHAPLAGLILDRAVESGREGVRHVLEDEADGRGLPTKPAQEGGVDVLAVVELLDRRLHACSRRIADVGLSVDDPRDGLEPDSRERGDVAHRRGTERR
jgi:hypothetical protein